MENAVHYTFIKDNQVLGSLDVDRFGDEAPAEIALRHRDETYPGARAFVQVHEENRE